MTANTCAGVFASGQSCAITVQYVPTLAGSQPAVLNIASNASGRQRQRRTDRGRRGAGTAGTGVAGAGARSRFALRKLRTTHRLSRARVRSHGLRFTMRLPAGTEIVKVSVLRVRNGKALRKPVWFAFRRPSHAGLYRMRLEHAQAAPPADAGPLPGQHHPGREQAPARGDEQHADPHHAAIAHRRRDSRQRAGASSGRACIARQSSAVSA